MAKIRGGMEFRPGRPIRLPTPPDTIATGPLRLRCPQRPEVVEGQVVKRGDALIRPQRDSASCHVAPFTGTVRQVVPASGPGGSSALGGYDVTIEPAGQAVSTSLEVPPPRGRKLEAWFATLRQIGPWADRDGNVGLIPQLEAARTARPDTLICVGLDPFPPYPDRSSLLMSFPDDVVLGTLILGDLLGAPNVSVLAGKSAPVLGRLRPSCKNYRVRLVSTANIFPYADPTLVAWKHAPSRRRLPGGTNPVAHGLVLITPWTAIRIGRWCTLRKIDLIRPLFLALPDAQSPLSSRYAFPGQPLSSVDSRLTEYAHSSSWRVIYGNPMTGRPASILAPPESDPPESRPPGADHPHHVDRTRNTALLREVDPVVPDDELVVAVMPRLRRPAPRPCISCGWCADVCPTQLRPVHLMNLCRSRRDDETLLDHLPWCVDCGLCTHVCPSSLPLAQTLRATSQSMGHLQ